MNQDLREKIIDCLKTVYDPEIPVNIWDLGLFYELIVDDSEIKVTMTLTSAFCPSAEEIPEQVREQIENACQMLNTADRTISIDVVFDPAWTPERVSEEARLEMGMYDYDQEINDMDVWREDR
jgi:metal-sulfur cluster biosynthetic enzyme